jgi:hypothetical protein
MNARFHPAIKRQTERFSPVSVPRSSAGSGLTRSFLFFGKREREREREREEREICSEDNDDETTRELLLEKTLNTRNETIFGGKNFSKNSLQKEI